MPPAPLSQRRFCGRSRLCPAVGHLRTHFSYTASHRIRDFGFDYEATLTCGLTLANASLLCCRPCIRNIDSAYGAGLEQRSDCRSGAGRLYVQRERTVALKCSAVAVVIAVAIAGRHVPYAMCQGRWWRGVGWRQCLAIVTRLSSIVLVAFRVVSSRVLRARIICACEPSADIKPGSHQDVGIALADLQDV